MSWGIFLLDSPHRLRALQWRVSEEGAFFCVKGESDHPGLSDGEVGARTPLTLTYNLLHFGAADHSMRPLWKRSQWENPKASVDVSARASQFARKRIYGAEVMGVVPLELPSQVFQTVATRPAPTRAGGPPGILSGALAAMEHTGHRCDAIATEMAVQVGGRFGYKWTMFRRTDKWLCHLGPNHQFESPLVGLRGQKLAPSSSFG